MQRLLNLALHNGGNEATMNEVRCVSTPEPTDTWCPIRHDELVDSVIGTLGGSGLRVVREVHALWQGGMRYFGSFQLSDGRPDSDYALVIGLRNSHDKSFPAGLAAGSSVFVCDNLSFSGEVRLARRHTLRIREDLPRLILTAVGRLGSMQANHEKRIGVYKDTHITDVQAHDLVIRAVDAKALPVTRIPRVLEEWRMPIHEEFAPRTAWSLHNAFTEIYKEKGNVETTLARSLPLYGLFDQLCGLRVIEEQFADATIEGGVATLV